MLKASQNRTKRAAFTEASMSSVPGEVRRLVRDDADGAAAEPREADDDVARVVPVHLEERPIVGDRVHEVEHVVGLVRRLRHEAIERLVLAVDRIGRLAPRRIVDVVARQVRRAARGSAAGTRDRPGTAKCATPLISLCVIAPPSSSFVTSSCVTVLITSGPVTNM